jgi:hypothetical protein
VSADLPVSSADRPPSAADRRRAAPADRPRRRVTAGELFEHVVPEDPPVMRFGRITPSSRLSSRPSPEPTSDDARPTMAFRDDETAFRDENKTVPLGADDTLPLGADDTLPLGADDTLPLGADDTLPLGADDTLPLPLRRRPEH